MSPCFEIIKSKIKVKLIVFNLKFLFKNVQFFNRLIYRCQWHCSGTKIKITNWLELMKTKMTIIIHSFLLAASQSANNTTKLK